MRGTRVVAVARIDSHCTVPDERKKSRERKGNECMRMGQMWRSASYGKDWLIKVKERKGIFISLSR